jgi:hypothetical protein
MFSKHRLGRLAILLTPFVFGALLAALPMWKGAPWWATAAVFLLASSCFGVGFQIGAALRHGPQVLKALIACDRSRLRRLANDRNQNLAAVLGQWLLHLYTATLVFCATGLVYYVWAKAALADR